MLGGALQLLEQRATARAEMPRHAVIDLRDQLDDGHIQCREREELPVAQLGDDKASRDLDPNFDLSFVPGPIRPCRQNGGAVVGRHLGVGAIDRWLVEAGFGDARAEIVGHHNGRSPSNEGKGARVRADPVGQALRPAALEQRVFRMLIPFRFEPLPPAPSLNRVEQVHGGEPVMKLFRDKAPDRQLIEKAIDELLIKEVRLASCELSGGCPFGPGRER